MRKVIAIAAALLLWGLVEPVHGQHMSAESDRPPAQLKARNPGGPIALHVKGIKPPTAMVRDHGADFQAFLDYARTHAHGRLAEILGPIVQGGVRTFEAVSMADRDDRDGCGFGKPEQVSTRDRAECVVVGGPRAQRQAPPRWHARWLTDPERHDGHSIADLRLRAVQGQTLDVRQAAVVARQASERAPAWQRAVLSSMTAAAAFMLADVAFGTRHCYPRIDKAGVTDYKGSCTAVDRHDPDVDAEGNPRVRPIGRRGSSLSPTAASPSGTPASPRPLPRRSC